MSLNLDADKLFFYHPSKQSAVVIPLYPSVVAGFPSPADDYMEEKLDLNRYLIKNPSATFYVRVEGVSMIGAGIFPKDMLIVDRSLRAKHNDIIIALVEGEFTVKRLSIQKKTRSFSCPKIPATSLLMLQNLTFKCGVS